MSQSQGYIMLSDSRFSLPLILLFRFGVFRVFWRVIPVQYYCLVPTHRQYRGSEMNYLYVRFL